MYVSPCCRGSPVTKEAAGSFLLIWRHPPTQSLFLMPSSGCPCNIALHLKTFPIDKSIFLLTEHLSFDMSYTSFRIYEVSTSAVIEQSLLIINCDIYK